MNQAPEVIVVNEVEQHLLNLSNLAFIVIGELA
jgi:hypothetical protein